MGARQSKRSVDITTTPKKEGIPAEGGVVVGDAAAPGDGKLERIEETDTKPTTNGIAPHTDAPEDKDKDDATEKEKEKPQQEEVKPEETKQESSGESPAEAAEVTTPTEGTPASPNTTAISPDSKETKKKEKMKKKWSFRSISFSKKDKSKPAREEAPKNGDVTKEEPLAEPRRPPVRVGRTTSSRDSSFSWFVVPREFRDRPPWKTGSESLNYPSWLCWPTALAAPPRVPIHV
ncbi:hypothetical protein KM043_002695 [Ampulex compressa]|nr:hypothetical protein KM043_002695 [Ampulex compressa]